jgi:hypothetical protein
MKIPTFRGDEDKDEIDLMEWLRMSKENNKNLLVASRSFFIVKLLSGG